MKSIKANFIFSMVKSLMGILFPVISFPYASRVLGVDAIGKVQFASSVISYFALFAALGISTYAIREGTKVRDDREKLSKLSRELLFINLFSTGIIYLFLIIFILLSVFNGYVILISILSLSMIFTTLGMDWIYQLNEDYMYISIRSVLLQILSIIMLFTFVKTESDYIIYAIIIVVANNGFFFFNFIYANKYIDIFTRTEIEIKKHIKPILMIFSVSLASTIYLNIDIVMINVIKNDYYVGLYTVAMKLNTVIRTLISSICVVSMPRLSYYIANKNYKQYNSLLRNGISLNLAFTIPTAIGMFMLSKEIIILFSGSAFLGAEIASSILAINIVFSSINSLLYQQVLMPYRKDGWAVIGTSVGACANILLNLIFIPMFSIEGAAITALISEMLVFFMFLYLLRKELDLHFLFNETYKLILACIPIVIIVYITSYFLSSFTLLLISIPLSAIAYFFALLLLKVTIARELLNDIRDLLLKVVK